MVWKDLDFVPNCRFKHHQKFVVGLEFRVDQFFHKTTLEFHYERENEEGERGTASSLTAITTIIIAVCGASQHGSQQLQDHWER